MNKRKIVSTFIILLELAIIILMGHFKQLYNNRLNFMRTVSYYHSHAIVPHHMLWNILPIILLVIFVALFWRKKPYTWREYLLGIWWGGYALTSWGTPLLTQPIRILYLAGYLILILLQLLVCLLYQQKGGRTHDQ